MVNQERGFWDNIILLFIGIIGFPIYAFTPAWFFLFVPRIVIEILLLGILGIMLVKFMD